MSTTPLAPMTPRVHLEIFLDEKDDQLLERILYHVLEEGDRAEQKHGKPTPNPLRCTNIVCEEAGEACEAALKLTAIDSVEREGQSQMHWLAELRAEWIQVASSAIRRIRTIDSGEMTQWLLDNPNQS
jgi:hypothetical protein